MEILGLKFQAQNERKIRKEREDGRMIARVTVYKLWVKKKDKPK